MIIYAANRSGPYSLVLFGKVKRTLAKKGWTENPCAQPLSSNIGRERCPTSYPLVRRSAQSLPNFGRVAFAATATVEAYTRVLHRCALTDTGFRQKRTALSV